MVGRDILGKRNRIVESHIVKDDRLLAIETGNVTGEAPTQRMSG